MTDSEIRAYKNKLRRLRTVRRQRIALGLIVAIIIFTAAFITVTLRSEAESEEFVPEYKYYRVITVHAGDTLFGIASGNAQAGHYKSIDDYMYEICSINHIEDDEVTVGENLIIPYFSTEYK